MGEALLAPSGDYVLLAPSGDYNQSIPPKSTNRIRCFTSRTVLLPTSAKLTRGIWEINRGGNLSFNSNSIQEHSRTFNEIQEHSRVLEWKNQIQEHSRLSATCANPDWNNVTSETHVEWLSWIQRVRLHTCFR